MLGPVVRLLTRRSPEVPCARSHCRSSHVTGKVVYYVSTEDRSALTVQYSTLLLAVTLSVLVLTSNTTSKYQYHHQHVSPQTYSAIDLRIQIVHDPSLVNSSHRLSASPVKNMRSIVISILRGRLLELHKLCEKYFTICYDSMFLREFSLLFWSMEVFDNSVCERMQFRVFGLQVFQVSWLLIPKLGNFK